jgi:hypothetical protein
MLILRPTPNAQRRAPILVPAIREFLENRIRVIMNKLTIILLMCIIFRANLGLGLGLGEVNPQGLTSKFAYTFHPFCL